MSEIELRTPSQLFVDEAKKWHDNEQLNFLTGFGRGHTGRKLATDALDKVLEDCPISIQLFAVWQDRNAIGYVAFTDIDPLNHTADLHITMNPDFWDQGLGTRTLRAAVDLGMKDGLYRIVYSPLVGNKRAINAGFKAGFKLEARTRYSVWTSDGPQDQAQMRVVKPEWRKRNR